MDYKIAICGKKEEIIAFKGIGLQCLFVETSEMAEKKLLEITKKNEEKFAIVFITEDFFQEFSKDCLEKISGQIMPAVVPIPGPKGSTGFGDKRMKKFVEQAVGSDIFGDD